MSEREERRNDDTAVNHGRAESPLRRKLLAATIAGSAGAGLPAAWNTPAVERILLPVHAQTTGEQKEPEPPEVEPISGIFVGSEELDPEIVLRFMPSGLLDRLVGPALAVIVVSVDLCAEIEDGVADVTGIVQVGAGSDPFSMTINIPGVDFKEVDGGCSLIAVELTSVSGNAPNRQLEVEVTVYNGTTVESDVLARETFTLNETTEGCLA